MPFFQLTIMIIMLVLTDSCSSAPLPVRPFEKRVYEFCDQVYVPNSIGKLCYGYCARTNWLDKCVDHEWIIEDLKDPVTFAKFFTSGKKIGKKQDMAD